MPCYLFRFSSNDHRPHPQTRHRPFCPMKLRGRRLGRPPNLVQESNSLVKTRPFAPLERSSQQGRSRYICAVLGWIDHFQYTHKSADNCKRGRIVRETKRLLGLETFSHPSRSYCTSLLWASRRFISDRLTLLVRVFAGIKNFKKLLIPCMTVRFYIENPLGEVWSD